MHIQLRNIVKEYPNPAGAHQVLNNVNLDLVPGDFVAIVGSSGVGKTTLLNMITGVDAPTQGEVLLDGQALTEVKQLTKWRARQMGIVFQFFQLLPTLTIAQNVMAPMDYGGTHPRTQRRAVADKLLELLGIADQVDKTPDMLSGGQQQRAAIARALANGPRLIVGDEPTANLDRMSAERVFSLFRQYAERGATVIVTTYDQDAVKHIPTVLKLEDGQLHPLSNGQGS